MAMGKTVLSAGLILLLSLALPLSSHAQLEFALEQLTGETALGYLQPFVDVFGSELNSGLYRTAKVPAIGLNFFVGVVAMGTTIPDDRLTFMGKPPAPYPQTEVETATVFGGEGAVVKGAEGIQYIFQDGQIQGNFVPLAVPHIEVGSLFGTRLKLRYFAFDLGEDIGELKFFGYGLQHSVSQYLPLFPIDISVGLFKQTFDVGDIITADVLSYGVQASKSFGKLTVYGAANVENTTLEASYTYKAEDYSESITLKLENKNAVRLTAGVGVHLVFFHLNADFTLGSYNTASLGIGFGL